MKNKKNLLPIIVMMFLFGMISFVTNLASPIGDILKHQFGVANWMGTLGVFANFIAYAIMGFPAGNMLQKLGYKKTALIAIAVGFIGVGIQTISGYAKSFPIYLIGAFIAGFSMCLLNTVVNPMLNKLGGGGNKGNQLIQTGGAFNSLCGTAVIIITGLLIPSIADAKISHVAPLMYTALSVFAFAFVVILLTKIPENNEKVVEKTIMNDKYGPLSFRHFILGAIAIFIYVGVEVGIPNVLHKWLQNPDLDVLKDTTNDEAIAATVAGTYWFLMLIGRLLGAAIGSKVSAKSMISAVSVVGIILTVIAIFAPVTSFVNLPVFDGSNGFAFANVPISAALLVCIGLCTSVMWGGIFNMAVEGLGKYTEKASGIFMALVCGGGILPLLQNAIVDITGTAYMESYWVIVVGLAYILFYALIGSKNVNKDIVTE